MAGRVLGWLLLAGSLCAQAPPAPAPIRVEGRVVDLEGKPVAGVDVHTPWLGDHWTTAEFEAKADARSDADGRYVLSIEPTQSLLLRFTARGFCTAQYQHFLQATSEPVPNARVPTIALVPAVTRIGRARSSDGKPIRGALVTTRDLAPSAVSLRDFAVSDEQGVFKLAGAPASPIEVTVTAADHAPVRLLPVDRETPLDVRMDVAGFCSGTLRSADGKPVAGYVGLAFEDGEMAGAKTEDGTFRFALRPGLRWRLSHFDPTGSVLSEVFAAPADGLDLRVPGGAETKFVEVHARSAVSGAPVPEFTVTVMWNCRDPEEHGHVYVGYVPTTGRDGVARVRVDSPSWQPGLALVRAEGHAEQIVPLPEHLETGTAKLALELLPERTIRGKVVDADGKPVPGALVWPMTLHTRISSYSGYPSNTVRTGADGTFACRGLAAADYALNVQHRAFPDAPPMRVSLATGDASDVQLTLGRPQRVEVSWRNAPKDDGDWWLDLMPSSPDEDRKAAALPHHSVDCGRVRAPVSFAVPLVLPAVPAARARPALHRLTQDRLAREIEIPFDEQRLNGPTSWSLELGRLQTGRIRGRVVTTALAAMDHLLVRAGGRWPPAPACLPARDGSFELEVPPGKHRLEVVDLLAGCALARSDELRVAAGEKVECELAVAAGVLDVAIGLPAGATRTAMYSIAVQPPGAGELDYQDIPLADLQGGVRLVLPPGPVKLGFRRARGVLGPNGATIYVKEEATTVDVPDGKVLPFVLVEPPRRSTAELANERHQ
jgi:hypothetical protein